MLSVKNWLKINSQKLAEAGISSAQLDAELILCDAIGQSREWLIIHLEDKIPENTAHEIIKRRQNREPLAYIRGFKEFYGRNFLVNKNVLIPRPESELMIELLKRISKDNDRILDVGTGSGVLAVTASLELTNAVVSACDISQQALEVARKNAKRLKAEVSFQKSDLLANIRGDFDIILANLPYVDKSWQRSAETDFEPSLALFANENGLSLVKKLIVQSREQLHFGGLLFLEADPRQHETIINFAKDYGFSLYKKQDFIIVLKS